MQARILVSFAEWFTDNWQFIASFLVTALSVVGALVGIKVSYNSSTKTLTAEKVKLDTENARLKRAIVEGAYIICPHCGEVIFLKDVEVKVKETNIEKD